MRRFLPLSLGAVVIVSIPLVAFSLVHASPGPGAPAHWTAARDLSNSPDGTAGPRIGVDDNGYLHLVWIDYRTGNGDLYYTKSTDGGTSWSAFDPITDTHEFRQSAIELGSDDSVHVAFVKVWNESYQEYYIEYAKKSPGEAWQVSDMPGGVVYQHSPALVVSGDYLYAVWVREGGTGSFQIFYSYKPLTGDTWSTPEMITTTATTSLYPDIIADRHGNVHLVWQEDVNQGAIWYSAGSGIGALTWSPVITVSDPLTGCATPAIAMGSDDYVHVVWGQKISRDEQYVYYASFPYTDTSSITPVQVFTEAIGVSEIAPTYLFPRVAIRGDSELHLVWHGKRATEITDQIWYAVSEDKGNNWSSPIKVSHEATRQGVAPDIALRGEIEHVVWQGKDEDGIYQVMYSRGFPHVVSLPIVTKGY